MKLLLAIVDEAYGRPAWHGPNLKGSVRRLTEELQARGVEADLVTLPLIERQIPVVADSHVDPTFGSGAVKSDVVRTMLGTNEDEGTKLTASWISSAADSSRAWTSTGSPGRTHPPRVTTAMTPLLRTRCRRPDVARSLSAYDALATARICGVDR